MNADGAAARPVFAVGDDVYRWEDVVEFARVRSDWAALAEQVRTGLRAVRSLRARGEEPDEAEVDEVRREFRYARGLLAADELEDWLERRGLAFDDWAAYVEREVARRENSDAAGDVDDTEVDACLWAEAMCSRLLDQTAAQLARRVAACPGVSLEGLDDAFSEFRSRAVTDELTRREVEVNQLEWLRFVYERADFASEDAALEAALCVRNDGDSLGDVASRAGVPLEQRIDWLDELAPELVPLFLAARPGGVVGPVQTDDAYMLALLREKRPPHHEDDAVRERAENAVIERVIERETNERVVWLERL